MNDRRNPLNGSEKKELRGLAQRLKPHTQIGKHGLTEAVINEIEIALTNNGLIKIRFNVDRDGIRNLCDEIARKTDSEYVGGVGKVGVFFRDMPEKA